MTAAFEFTPGGDPSREDYSLDEHDSRLRASLRDFMSAQRIVFCDATPKAPPINVAIDDLENRLGSMPLRAVEIVDTLFRSAEARGRPLEPLIQNYLLADYFIDLKILGNKSDVKAAWHELLLCFEKCGEDMAEVCYDYADEVVNTSLDASALERVFRFATAEFERDYKVDQIKKDIGSLIHFEEEFSHFPEVLEEILRQRLAHDMPVLAKYRPALEFSVSIGQRTTSLLKTCDKKDWDIYSLLESMDLFNKAVSACRVFNQRERLETLLVKVLDAYEDKGRDPAAAIAGVTNLGGSAPTQSITQELAPMFEQGRGLGLICHNLFSFLPTINEQNLWEQILRIGDAYERVYCQLSVYDASTITTRLVGHIEKVLSFDPRWISRIAPMLETSILDPEIFDSHFTELKAEAIMPTLLYGRDPVQRAMAVSSFQEITRNDHVPFSEEDPRAAQVRKESFLIMRRIWDLYAGFGALTFEGMRRGEKLASLAEFGLDSAGAVHGIRADDKDVAPGRGYLISYLSKDNLFARSKHGQKDPHEDLKLAMPWAARELDDIERTRYLTLRKCIAVIPPQLPKYEIEGVHYTFIAWNDHFHNGWCDRASLVPTLVVMEQLKNSAYEINNSSADFSSSTVDINTRGLNPHDLDLICREKGLVMLDVGSGSVLGGGMCNAFPVGSSPYHDWENMVNQYVTKDIWGHRHKSYMVNGSYQRDMDEKLDKALEPLREAHNIVRDVTNRCLNLLTWFQLGNAFWRKGQTVPFQRETFSDGSGDSNFGSKGISVPTPELTRAERRGSFTPTPYSHRMLMQAYDWHNVFNQAGADQKAFPVLGSVDALRYSVQPKQMLLDTYDLRLWNGSAWQQLPQWSDGTGAEEQEVWNNKILAKLGPLDDIRWYRREAFAEESKS